MRKWQDRNLFWATTLTALLGASSCSVEIAEEGGNSSSAVNDDLAKPNIEFDSDFSPNSGDPTHLLACSQPSDCASGFCVDGVCCDTACTSLCQACSAAKKGNGTDGVCGSIASGQDPDDECKFGTCNGSGGCGKFGGGPILLGNGSSCVLGSECASGFCTDGVCCNSACTSTCQACTAPKKGSGFDGTCGNIAPNTDPDNECSASDCNGSGTCGAASGTDPNGTTCGSGVSCLSGYCVDGVCCDNACTGTCQACTSAKKGGGTNGTCGPIANTTDPDNECALGNCNGAGACGIGILAGNGTSCSAAGQCASGFCVDGVCCNNACSSSCDSCNEAGSVGTCTASAASCCNGTLGFPAAPLIPPIEYSQTTWMSWMQWSVDTADFNGDGKQDLVVAGSDYDGISEISVHLQQSNGSFGAPTPIATPAFSRVVVAKDLNADGFPDVVSASSDAGGISVMLNNGQGGFAPPVAYATGTVGYLNSPRPDMLRVADVNSDGILDVLTANISANTVSLLLGQGNGTFPTKVDVPTPDKPAAIAVGDYNADGHADLAVTTYDAATTKDRVSVMMGQGPGTFGAAVHYVIAKNGRSLATADVNGDGKLDLICGNYNAGSGQKIFILRNQGNGTFAAPVGYNAGGMGRVVPADVTGDSLVDLVVAAFESQTIEILPGQSNGTFAARVPYSALGVPHGVAVVDVNNDGDKDIVAADRYRLATLENSGNGSFGPVVGSAPSFQLVSTVLRSADVNLDGFTDLAAGTSTGVKVALGQANGSFGTILTSPINTAGNPNPNDVQDMAFGDMNADGKLDLVIKDGTSRVVVMINQGNGLFNPVYNGYPPNSASNPLVVRDFNGDGKLDLAIAHSYVFETIAYHRWARRVIVQLFLGNGNGTLTAQAEQVLGEVQWDCAYCPAPPVGQPPFTANDFNGDGSADLAIFNGDLGGTHIVRNQGNGQFVLDYGPIPSYTGKFYSIDNGNGYADLILSSSAGVHLWRNSGNGSFVDGGIFWGGVNDVISVDVDGDGIKDVAAAGNGTNSLRLLQLPANSSGVMHDYAAGFTPISIASGDFNHDGKMDLAVQNKSPATVSILYNSCLP